MDEIPPGFRSCLSCTQSCYKEHWPFPSRDSFRAPCFVKALCDSNLASMATCWMVIPSAWLKLYGDDVGNSAVLLGPSGNTWQVGVSRPKWVAFRVGWRTFAADNCLEKGDMLIFTLIGKSKFSVKIFDSRTCLEKESSLTATNTGCYDSRSPVLLGEKRKQRDGCENVAELKRICLNDNEGVHLGNNEQPLESFRNGNGLQLSRAKFSIFRPAALISQRKCSLLDLNSKPLNMHPNPTNDGGRSFPEINQQLLDAVDARTLQEYASGGDMYQPHPISIRSHDVEEECSRQGQFKAQECGSGGLGPATRFAAQRRPVMDIRERLSEYQCRQNSSSALITADPSSQALDLNREHFAEVVGPQILSPAVILERGKALELARQAQDTINRPSHLVVLRAFHVHGRAFVRFPVTFGKQHMPRKTAPMHLLDSNGHRWPMTWLRDNETHMGLTRGWRDFCLAEGLSEGDVCIFELVEFNKLTLLIHVFRSTEARGSTQVIITKSKRLDLSHAGYVAHKKALVERRKISEEQGHPEQREEAFLDNDNDLRQPTTASEGQYDSFMPTKLTLSNAFHGCNRREYSTAGSVGRVRLKKLSLWASKLKDQGCLSPTGYSHGSKEDEELANGDMSKVQDTRAYGDILCQMSSGCSDAVANSEKAPASSIPTSTWMGLMRNNGTDHTLGEQGFGSQHSHVLDHMRNHGRRNLHKQWAKSQKQYGKGGKKKPSGWTWSTLSSSALIRKMQALSNQLYTASRRSFVTQAQKDAAKEAALALKTENPATLVVMKNSHVHNTFNVELSSSFSQQLSPELSSSERINIILSDAAGHKTKAHFTTQGVITRGWRQFSLEHLLEEGDVCIFELIDTSQLFVHIFRAVDIDHRTSSYRNHYRFISPGRTPRRTAKTIRKTTQSYGQVEKARQPRRLNKSLYSALQKTRAKLTAITTKNEWFRVSNQPLDLNLNLDPANVSNPPIDSPNGASTGLGFPPSPISDSLHHDGSGTSPCVPKDVVCEIVSRENEKRVMLDEEDDDSEPEEENYYRVVRILKKRYFGNEKQYLTELDGPVMQTSAGCEGIRDHEDVKWWVPEKSFSSGFASCYLR